MTKSAPLGCFVKVGETERLLVGSPALYSKEAVLSWSSNSGTTPGGESDIMCNAPVHCITPL